MRNIIVSDIYKLKKSKAFWICSALCLVFGFIIVLALRQGLNAGGRDAQRVYEMFLQVSGGWAMGTLMSMGFHLIFSGVFIAVFTSSEFIYGTMKNTLSRGVGRARVLFSRFIVCGAAALIMQCALMLSGLITGTLFWGLDPDGIITASGMLGMILTQSMLTLSFALLFVFVSVTLRSNGGAIAVNIICVTMVSTLLSAVSALLGGGLDLSKYWLVSAVSALATVTPASDDIVRGLLVAAAWGAFSVLAGTLLFKRLDIK